MLEKAIAEQIAQSLAEPVAKRVAELLTNEIARQVETAFRLQQMVIKLQDEHKKVLAELTQIAPHDPDADERLAPFARSVEDLELSVRTSNCLKNMSGCDYIGDLVSLTEKDLLAEPNLGRVSLNEIKDRLAPLGLHLGMEIPGWRPANVDDLAHRFQDHY